MSDVFNEIKKVYAAGGKPLIKWDEDQPRDEAGRFGSSSGGGAKLGPVPRHLEGLPRWSTKDLSDALEGKSGKMLPNEVKHIQAEKDRRMATVHGKEAARIRQSEAQMRSAGVHDIADNYAEMAQALEERSART